MKNSSDYVYIIKLRCTTLYNNFPDLVNSYHESGLFNPFK